MLSFAAGWLLTSRRTFQHCVLNTRIIKQRIRYTTHSLLVMDEEQQAVSETSYANLETTVKETADDDVSPSNHDDAVAANEKLPLRQYLRSGDFFEIVCCFIFGILCMLTQVPYAFVNCLFLFQTLTHHSNIPSRSSSIQALSSTFDPFHTNFLKMLVIMLRI